MKDIQINDDFFIGIVHYTPLKDRRHNLEVLGQDFAHLGWITEHDIDQKRFHFINDISLTTELKLAAGLRLNSFTQKYSRAFSRVIIQILLFCSRFSIRAKSSILGALPKRKPLEPKWQELILMHLKAIEIGLKSNKEWIVVLEDDSIIQANFKSTLSQLSQLSRFEKVWINLNDGAGSNLFKKKFDYSLGFGGFFKITPPMTRCSVAYVMNKNLAHSILKEFELYGVPNWLPIDFCLDAIIKKLKVDCFWQEPSSVVQGSSNGTYISNFGKIPE